MDSLIMNHGALVPMAQRDYQRTRQLGIGDLLLENRIIFLDGPIHDAMANLIVMKLLFLQSENRHQDVKRYILPHAKMMIHQPYGQVGGQVSDIEIQAKEILATREVLNQILADHTGQPIERVATDTERDRYLSPIQAKEYGLVDEVVFPKKNKIKADAKKE
jgi:ATP-dependent Clp protease protease subunit